MIQSIHSTLCSTSIFNNHLRTPKGRRTVMKTLGLVSSVVYLYRSAMLFPANLKVIESLFRDIAARSFGSSASIPLETLKLIPKLLRTLISQYCSPNIMSPLTSHHTGLSTVRFLPDLVKSRKKER